MKQYIFLYIVCVLGITIATNITNITLVENDDLMVNNEDDESFYTVDVLLVAEGASTQKPDQNETGLSIRLTAQDGTVSTWYRLYNNNESNYYGQRNYILSGNARYLGIISSITLRIDKPELAASSMPYYLCIHGKTTNNTINLNWNGCTYIQFPLGNKTSNEQQYPLRDGNGKSI